MEGNIRVYITESCNAKCDNCFNRFDRKNASMDIEHFELICDFFSRNNVSNIKIMGGEPTIHPNFDVFMNIAQRYFESVSLFTNGISDQIYKFFPRDNDSIIYNFRFSKAYINTEKLLLDKPGRRSLEIQITSKTNIEKLEGQLREIDKDIKHRLNPCLTLDCTEDIFEYRSLLVEKYEYIWNLCKKLGMIVGQDHLIPFCFIKGSHIPIPRAGAKCELCCAGLIDSHYNIKYCNQFSTTLGNLFEDHCIIHFNKYEKLLKMKRNELLEVNQNKGCERCPYWHIICNGGCFVAKESIQFCNFSKYIPK